MLIQSVRGIYILSDDFDDEYFLLQNRYKKEYTQRCGVDNGSGEYDYPSIPDELKLFQE